MQCVVLRLGESPSEMDGLEIQTVQEKVLSLIVELWHTMW